jgi:hypothetical protein
MQEKIDNLVNKLNEEIEQAWIDKDFVKAKELTEESLILYYLIIDNIKDRK